MREWSDPRLPIPPRNEQELQKGGRSSPKLLDLIRNKKRSKNGIGQELEQGRQSDLKFWSLINQKRPQNKTIIEELETRECSDPRTSTLPRNGKELQKGGRSSPKFLYSLQHRRGFKNETIDEELERRCCSHSKVWTLKTDQKELRNRISWELEKSSHNNPKFLDLIKNKKRSKNEMINREEGLSHHRFWTIKRDYNSNEFCIRSSKTQLVWGYKTKPSWELEEEGHNSNEFWIHKQLQKKPQNTNGLVLQEGYPSDHCFSQDYVKVHESKSKPRSKGSRHQKTEDLGVTWFHLPSSQLVYTFPVPRSKIAAIAKIWRTYCTGSLDTNVLYSIHYTVQYQDEAFKGSRSGFPAVMIEVDYGQARFTDTDIEERLTMDMFYTKIYEKQIIIQENRIVDKFKARVNKIDCMGPRLAPTCTEDKIDFFTVVSRANIDASKMIEVRLVDIDIMNMIVDEIRTEINEIDYNGSTPCTDRYYSNIDREVDNDGDKIVSVLQWLERKSRKRCQSRQWSSSSPSTSPSKRR